MATYIHTECGETFKGQRGKTIDQRCNELEEQGYEIEELTGDLEFAE